jgi:uncharacterized damage-inducible protein DinB
MFHIACFARSCDPGKPYCRYRFAKACSGEIVMSLTLASLARSALIDELESQRKAVHELAESISEKEFWIRPIDPGNSVGHLVLHLTGNLNHFVGAQLGHTGYVRDREREFSDPNPPSKKVALANLEAAVAMFRNVVEKLTDDQLLAPHPESRFGPVYKGLVHIVGHFAIHRGQMSYIERLVKRSGDA